MNKLGKRTKRGEIIRASVMVLIAATASFFLFVNKPRSEKASIDNMQQQLSEPVNPVEVKADSETSKLPAVALASISPQALNSQLSSRAQQSGVRIVSVSLTANPKRVTVAGSNEAIAKFGAALTASRFERGGQMRGSGRFLQVAEVRSLPGGRSLFSFTVPGS